MIRVYILCPLASEFSIRFSLEETFLNLADVNFVVCFFDKMNQSARLKCLKHPKHSNTNHICTDFILKI